MFGKELLHLPRAASTIVVLVAFGLLQAACIVAQAGGLSLALVGLWRGEAFTEVLGAFSVFACAFVIVRIVLDLREAFISSYAQRTTEEMRRRLLRAIFRTGAPIARRFGTGASVAMVLEGVDKTKSCIELVLPKLIDMVVLPLVFALAILCADWVSAVVVVILLPSMMLLMMLIGKTTASKGRAQHATFKAMSNHFIDSTRGIETLEAFEVSRSYADRVFEVSERFRQATMDTLKTATLSGSVLDLFATLAIAAVSIMLGLRLIDGSLMLLPALFVLILTPEYFRAIREFASDYHASLDGENALRSIEEMIVSVQEPAKEDEIPHWDETSALRLDEVSKAYGSSRVLEDISLTLGGFEHIGVIGASGSGKSTLLRILAGFEDPSSGSFTIASDQRFGANDTGETSCTDGASAVACADANTCELDTLRQAAWQDQIAYIPQDPYLFSASLRDNLTFYNPRADDERIVSVLELLGLTEFVAQLSLGLDTPLGEGGHGLSGGQAQRIALARVLLDDSRKIVLFDEPTAHLDIETEYELKQAMLEVMKGKLVIFATHRLHWLDTFDRIFVLEEGCIVEAGTLDELRAQGKCFARLVSALRGGGAA